MVAMGSSQSLDSLPIELQHLILTYLPVASLSAFARTSKHNYSNVLTVLTQLELAILPRRIHGVLALLNASPSSSLDDDSTLRQVIVPASSLSSHSSSSRRDGRSSSQSSRSRRSSGHADPRSHRHNLISHQTAVASQVLSSPLLTQLTTLTLHTYAFSSVVPSSTNLASQTEESSTKPSRSRPSSSIARHRPTLAKTLATALPCLRHLTLNFSHPYIHDPCLPTGTHFWTTPDRGSPDWNSLCGVGPENEAALKLTNLESLDITRAGITSRQIIELIRRNPRLSKLKLKCVAGVEVGLLKELTRLYEDHDAGEGDDNMAWKATRVPLRTLELDENLNLLLLPRAGTSNSAISWLPSSAAATTSSTTSPPSTPAPTNSTTEDPVAEFALAITSLVSSGLRHLSLKDCNNISSELLQAICAEHNWFELGLQQLVLPSSRSIGSRRAVTPDVLERGNPLVAKTQRHVGGLFAGAGLDGHDGDGAGGSGTATGLVGSSRRTEMPPLEVDPACM